MRAYVATTIAASTKSMIRMRFIVIYPSQRTLPGSL
jgi:hypothetical protein